jgi:hypothetical protein
MTDLTIALSGRFGVVLRIARDDVIRGRRVGGIRGFANRDAFTRTPVLSGMFRLRDSEDRETTDFATAGTIREVGASLQYRGTRS